jgi:hypothetical protein
MTRERHRDRGKRERGRTAARRSKGQSEGERQVEESGERGRGVDGQGGRQADMAIGTEGKSPGRMEKRREGSGRKRECLRRRDGE